MYELIICPEGPGVEDQCLGVFSSQEAAAEFYEKAGENWPIGVPLLYHPETDESWVYEDKWWTPLN